MLILLPLLGIFGNALVAEVEASLSLSLGFKAIKLPRHPNPANCSVGNTTFAHGVTFKLDCKTQCVCENGRHACSTLCPNEQLPAPEDTISCRSPRLVEVPGHCCKMWLCENPTADVYATCHNSTTSGNWTDCSRSCGLGTATRHTSTHAGCHQLSNLRLCENRRCDKDDFVDNKSRSSSRSWSGSRSGSYPLTHKRKLHHSKSDSHFHSQTQPHHHHHQMEPAHRIRKGHECRSIQRLGPARIRLGECISRKLYRPKLCGRCHRGVKCCAPAVSTTIQVELLCPLNAVDPINYVQQREKARKRQLKEQQRSKDEDDYDDEEEEQPEEAEEHENLPENAQLWDTVALEPIDQEFLQSHQIQIENKFIAVEWILKCECSTSALLSKTKQTARIVIIGAGSAGIAAATRLLEQGFRNVLLIEAEDRIGGRINTIPFADNVVDLGGQWCHGEQGNIVYQTVKDLDLLEATEDHYETFKCVRSNQEVLPQDIADNLKSIAFKSIPDRQTELVDFKGTLGDYINQKFWKELAQLPPIDRTIAEEFLDIFHKFEASVEAADHLFEVSGKGHLEYWLCEGELLLNWRDKGYKQFLRVLMKARADQPDDLGVLKGRVLLNRRISQINWSGEDEVTLRCWNGEILTADHVICTVSLGVLKEQHRQLFTPALPAAKVSAIEGLKLGTVDKFFLEYESPPLPSDWPGINFLWLKQDLEELRASELFWLESVFGFYPVSYQPRILQGWIIGPHARHMETLTEEKVLEGLLWLFRKFLAFEMAHPRRMLRTQWHANPNFRGSYTFRSTYTDQLRTGAWDLEAPLLDVGGKPKLQFAGESSHKHFYSTVHGAVETGFREADRLNAFYRLRTAQL